MGVTRLLLLGPFYYIQTNFSIHTFLHTTVLQGNIKKDIDREAERQREKGFNDYT